MTRSRWALLVLLLSLMSAPAAQAGEACYLLMFGSQRVPARPNYSHSFATFVRVTWADGAAFPAGCTIETVTISWLPQNLVVRLLAVCPEPGHNFGLHETLKYVLASKERVSLWGPYQIEPDVYRLATVRRDWLESQALYKADDSFHNTRYVSNCIHAISGVLTGGRLRVASPAWGETASYAILRRFMPYVIDCDQTHPWLVYALGLDCYPIIYRDLQRPRSGTFAGPINRLFGGEHGLSPSYGPPR